jgi:hypothetical protein
MGYDPIDMTLNGPATGPMDPLQARQTYEEDEQRKREMEQQAILEQQQQEADAQAAAQQKQKQEAASANPIGEVGAAVVGGLVDFTDDILEVGGKLTGHEWEAIPEDWGPQNKTDWGKATRAIVSFVGPTIGISSLTKAGLLQVAKMGAMANTSKAVSIIGNLGVDMAAGTAVDAINSHSEEDNLSGFLKKQFPGSFDWLPDDLATLDTDSPDLKRKKNILEGAGLGLLSSVIEGSVAFAKALKGKAPGVVFKPKDEAAKKAFDAVTNKSPQTRSAHPIIDRILKDENYRQQHIDEMALKELDEVGGIENVDTFSPNLHSEVADLSESIPHAVKPDAIPQMMVDNARILENIDSQYGRPAKFHTDAAIKAMSLDDLAGRKLVKQLDDKMKEYGNFEAVLPNGRMMNKKELLSAGDDLAAKILDPTMSGEALRKLLDQYRDKIQIITNAPSAKPINAEASAAAKSALKELGALYLNPDMQRASAYIQAGLAGEASDLATSARVMGEALDPTYIQERILDKMEVLWFETDMASSIKGWALNNEKIWQEAVKARSQNPAELKAFGREALEAFKTAKKLKAEANRTFWVELKNMNKSNPQFVAPLMRAYELTDGNVNSMYKLNNYMKEVLGVTNKAFIDGAPEIPSQVVQGMWATLYNAKLSSLLTPVKAIANNFALLLMKPANVALGAAIRGDWHTLHRGWMQYATHMDTTMRSSADYMSQMFKKVAEDPSITQRLDFKTTNNEMLTLAREFAEAEAAKGNMAPAMKMQFVDTMQKINNHPWVRYSMNMMEAGDGFVKSAIAMSEARGRAYDDLFLKLKRAPNADELQKAASDIYKQMFDKNGLITDSAVKYSAGEISMNLDNEYAQHLDAILKKAPLLKTVVLFPRTSVNVLDFIHKHSPLSYFIGDLQKVRTLKEPDEIARYLATKGIDVAKQPLDQAWKSYRAEVEGRVAMGTMLVTMGGWMYASGSLTGNGNYDKQVNKFQQNAGERPLRSWKGPDGKWRSYDGIEPIATFLALTADILENTNTLGSTASEQLLQKLGYAVSMNLTNKSFLQGLQPITELMSGQPNAINRWASNTASVGLFNQMSRIMMPGLREVDSDLGSMMRNKWNILDAAGIGKALPKSYDFIDGSVVGANDPITNFLNNTLPFKTNSDPSPVKQFLIDTEFDVQPSLAKSIRGAKYNAEQRSRLSQIMGESGHFRTGLEILMKDPRVAKDLQAIRVARSQGITQEQADLSNSYTHTRIRRLLTQTLNLAKRQLADEMPDIRAAELTAKKTRQAQRSSDYGTVLQLQNK